MDASDAGLYRALYTDPRVMAEIGPPLTPEAADAAFARVVRHNGLDVPGHRAWTIEDRETDERLGLVALVREGDGTTAELGIMLVPAAWTGRVAVLALRHALEAGFESQGLSVVRATCREGRNVRVVRGLLRPFGFQWAGSQGGIAEWRLARREWLGSKCEIGASAAACVAGGT